MINIKQFQDDLIQNHKVNTPEKDIPLHNQFIKGVFNEDLILFKLFYLRVTKSPQENMHININGKQVNHNFITRTRMFRFDFSSIEKSIKPYQDNFNSRIVEMIADHSNIEKVNNDDIVGKINLFSDEIKNKSGNTPNFIVGDRDIINNLSSLSGKYDLYPINLKGKILLGFKDHQNELNSGFFFNQFLYAFNTDENVVFERYSQYGVIERFNHFYKGIIINEL